VEVSVRAGVVDAAVGGVGVCRARESWIPMKVSAPTSMRPATAPITVAGRAHERFSPLNDTGAVFGGAAFERSAISELSGVTHAPAFLRSGVAFHGRSEV
jgi:hypothetical protein